MTTNNIHQFLLVGLLHVALFHSASSAQNPIPVNATVSGGGATVETVGSIQMSVGQVFYLNEKSADFNINQGIQQPSVYELVSTVEELTCGGFVLDNKELYKGEVFNGVMILPYLKGNGAYFLGLNLPSSGVSGLNLSLQPGKLANGNGSVELVIKGTPADTGLAIFNLTFGAKTCTFNLPVTILEPKISTLNCGSIVVSPKDIGSKLEYSGVVTVSYQGGNNRKSYPIEIASSVVKGLTLKADSLLLNSTGGTLSLNLTGTPDTAGIAFFPLTIGEKTCNVLVKVIESEIIIPNVFTPNEDGKNDLWSIPALAFKPESKVFIFDRLGRLLIEYPGSSAGWNGLINNYPATAGDYWYVIQISKDAVPLNGNFTLLR
ncbi:MAG: T9SS type B sorting domain-containing protein [Bacteroidota bacterium]